MNTPLASLDWRQTGRVGHGTARVDGLPQLFLRTPSSRSSVDFRWLLLTRQRWRSVA